MTAIEVHPLFDQRLKEEYANPAEVSKMVEGEAEAGETDSD